MRAALPIIASLAIAACSSDYPGPAAPPAEQGQNVVPAATPDQRTPAANFPELEGTENEPDPDKSIVLDFVRTDPHTQAHLDALRRGNSTTIIRLEPAEPQGGMGMSYDPELRRMGLKVGRDGNLHRVGSDARSTSDPDEGPVVDWDELHRKQFGR